MGLKFLIIDFNALTSGGRSKAECVFWFVFILDRGFDHFCCASISVEFYVNLLFTLPESFRARVVTFTFTQKFILRWNSSLVIHLKTVNFIVHPHTKYFIIERLVKR